MANLEVITAPLGTYLVAAVDVIDPVAAASAHEGRRKVCLGKELGVSVEGKVNEQVAAGIISRLGARGVDAFVTMR